MRMDTTADLTAADILNWYSETELAEIFLDFGEEPRAKLFAHCICMARKLGPLTTTKQLAELIEANSPIINARRGGIYRHPATRVFQALRIVVNDELSQIEKGLDAAFGVLQPTGIMIVISFHALEDRIVKSFLARTARAVLSSWSAQPVLPTTVEVMENIRARSAKLRWLRKSGK